MDEFKILGNKITALTVDELNNEIKSIILQNRKELILNTNVHGINLAQQHPWLKEFRNNAKIVHCDGAGVQLAGKFLGLKIAQRITIHDWMGKLAEFCEINNFSFFFLGAKPGRAVTAAAHLLEKFPNLKILGTQHGYFNKEGSESQKVISDINKVKPDILIVGFGMPIQEKWIKDNWEQIEAHIFIAGGGCFDVLSGALLKCPSCLSNHGFEWLFRLFMEPKRLFKRYVIGNPKFMLQVILNKFGLLKQ